MSKKGRKFQITQEDVDEKDHHQEANKMKDEISDKMRDRVMMLIRNNNSP